MGFANIGPEVKKKMKKRKEKNMKVLNGIPQQTKVIHYLNSC